jgi:hypothetical protein
MANTFINKISGSIGTVETIIYTTPPNTTTTVIGVSVANRIQSNIHVDAKLVQSGDINEAYFCSGSLIPPGSNIILVGGEQKVVMKDGDYLTLKSDTANSTDIVLSALEITP